MYVEFAGNLVPVTKSGEQLKLVVRAFKENRLPFTMRVKDPSAEPRSWTIIMKEQKVRIKYNFIIYCLPLNNNSYR